MSSDDSWTERGRQLHESFFAQRNEQRLAELRETLTANERKQALASASGISDDEVLDHLLNANIQAETIAALGIVPLLAVAWADGQLDDREKQAVLAACEDEGIAPGSECYALLDGWLQQAPSANLLSAWKDFISAARTKLSAEALSALQDDVLGRAAKIAQTSGGILGIRTISGAENRVLKELQQAFG